MNVCNIKLKNGLTTIIYNTSFILDLIFFSFGLAYFCGKKLDYRQNTYPF